MSATDTQSPSYQRRKALRDADAVNVNKSMNTIMSSYPLDKYFEISSRLLFSFQEALDERRLDETYIYGIRFCSFSVQALPKHRDYKLAKYNKQRTRNAQQVDKVLKTMEIVTQRMDVEETMRIRRQQEQEEERRQQEEEQRLQEEQEEEERLREEEQKQRLQLEAEVEKKRLDKKNVEQSAYAKLQAMKDKMKMPAKQVDSSKKEIKQESSRSVSVKSTPKSPKKTAKKEATRPTTTTSPQPTKPKTKTPTNNTAVSKDKEKPKTTTKQKEVATSKAKNSEITAPSTAKAAITPASKAATKSDPKPSPYRRRAATTAEEKTIQKLEDTIQKQEARLEQIQDVQIPALLQQAKQHLRDKNRKAALSCVRKKRKLEQMMDVSKGAIFQLETQIFQIETAMEDRQAHEALQAASKAMDGIHKSVGINADTLQEDLASMVAMSEPTAVDVDVDDEELLEELEQWMTPQKNKTKSKLVEVDDDDISILSLPKVPLSRDVSSVSSSSLLSETAKANGSTTTSSSSVRNLMKAVLG